VGLGGQATTVRQVSTNLGGNGKEASGIRENLKKYFLTPHEKLPWQEAASYA